MNMKAIERIKDYCCEVTQEQWDELVSVADEVGVNVFRVMNKPDKFARRSDTANTLGVYSHKHRHHKLIPFSEFFAKLKSEEEWQPKAGEMVEVQKRGDVWVQGEFIAVSRGWFLAWDVDGFPTGFKMCRPLRPTITREQAEKELNKRIID